MPTENVNVNRGSVYDGLDNFPGHAIQDYTGGAREYKPWFEKLDWKVEAVRAVVLLLSLMVAWALFGIWRAGYCWDSRNWQACERIDAIQPVGALAAILLVVGLPAARVLLWALGEYQLNQARAARVATTFNDWGSPVRVDLMTAPEYEPGRYAQRVELKRVTAPYEVFHSVNTYSPSFPQAKEAAVLPAPAETVGLIPPDTWLAWLEEAPHLLISGPTGAGKTTLARAILAHADGADLLVLDPHDAAGKWPAAAVGGGRDYDGIYQAIDGLMAEMNARFAQMRLGETRFPRLIVLLDEAPAVALHDLKRWQGLVSRLTSEARKVEMRFIVLAQSHLVRDIGLSSLVRRNLGLVALGPQAIDLVKDETERDRLVQLLTLVRHQKRPAAYAYASQTEVLDVSTVPQLARQAITLAPWGWLPPQPTPEEQRRQATIDALRRGAQMSRRQARANGLRFGNDRWPDVKG